MLALPSGKTGCPAPQKAGLSINYALEEERVGKSFHLTLCTDCDYIVHRNTFWKWKDIMFSFIKTSWCTTNISITIYVLLPNFWISRFMGFFVPSCPAPLENAPPHPLLTTPLRYLFLGSTRYYTIFWVLKRVSHDICDISHLVKMRVNCRTYDISMKFVKSPYNTHQNILLMHKKCHNSGSTDFRGCWDPNF